MIVPADWLPGDRMVIRQPLPETGKTLTMRGYFTRLDEDGRHAWVQFSAAPGSLEYRVERSWCKAIRVPGWQMFEAVEWRRKPELGWGIVDDLIDSKHVRVAFWLGYMHNEDVPVKQLRKVHIESEESGE
jgi:hypothetical protein